MTHTKPVALGLGVLLAATLIVLAALPADAARRYRRITVQSEYTLDTATAAVRRDRHGWQVRLPSGMWIPCEFNCFYTLRRNTVDFWERFNENSGD